MTTALVERLDRSEYMRSIESQYRKAQDELREVRTRV
jgi:hypothetical protein